MKTFLGNVILFSFLSEWAVGLCGSKKMRLKKLWILFIK